MASPRWSTSTLSVTRSPRSGPGAGSPSAMPISRAKLFPQDPGGDLVGVAERADGGDLGARVGHRPVRAEDDPVGAVPVDDRAHLLRRELGHGGRPGGLQVARSRRAGRPRPRPAGDSRRSGRPPASGRGTAARCRGSSPVSPARCWRRRRRRRRAR